MSKGKGKGDRRSGKTDKKNLDQEDSSQSEFSFDFSPVSPVDYSEHCPKYCAVLERSEGEGISTDDLDMLQAELEMVLASVAKRMHIIEEEINNINQIITVEKVSTKDVARGKGEKRKAEEESRPTKKLRESGKGSSTPNRGKVKHSAKVIESSVASPLTPAPVESVPRPKNDVAERFWMMMEPYYAKITGEDIKYLEGLINNYNNLDEYYCIPPLGKSYAKKWSEEDLREEQKEGSKVEKRRETGKNSDIATMMKKAEEAIEADSDSPYGPLTQRLVAALIEENIMAPLESNSIPETELSDAITMSPRSLAKQLNISNAANLERRIKMELEEQGLLDFDANTDEDPSDEVLCELKKAQSELQALSLHNMSFLKELIVKAKEEMNLQDLRSKLSVIDNEVTEVYKNLQSLKAKRKILSKKEKEPFWRLIKEREAILKKLESAEVQ